VGHVKTQKAYENNHPTKDNLKEGFWNEVFFKFQQKTLICNEHVCLK
jgi:hypothetical protein